MYQLHFFIIKFNFDLLFYLFWVLMFEFLSSLHHLLTARVFWKIRKIIFLIVGSLVIFEVAFCMNRGIKIMSGFNLIFFCSVNRALLKQKVSLRQLLSVSVSELLTNYCNSMRFFYSLIHMNHRNIPFSYINSWDFDW